MIQTVNQITKNIGIKYAQYKGNAIRLSIFNPYTVDEVIIKTKNKHNPKIITTFRDSDGKIIERIFDYPQKPLRNRLYSQTDNTIGTDEFVESKTIKDYYLERDAIKYYKDFMQLSNKNRFIFWGNKKTLTNHVSYNLDKDEIILTQTSVKNKQNSSKQSHSFIEFPKIKFGKITNEPKKYLKFDIRKSDNCVIKKSIHSNIKVPNEDKYLGFRALTIEDAKIPFTKKFLIERNMDDKNINIYPQYNPIHEDSNFNAIFKAEDGSINFNKDVTFVSKSKLVKTSRHEVEHSWQFFLQALLKKGDTPWQTEMSEQFGPLKDKKLIKEAKVYDKSIENYTPYYVDNTKYKNNYIEKEAIKKGIQEQENYDFDGKSIRESFKHIPAKLL